VGWDWPKGKKDERRAQAMTDKVIKIKEKSSRFAGWVGLLLTIAALLAAGCEASIGAPQTPTRDTREPFSARAEREDGAIVAWRGYTEGYEPGAQAEFDITIKNETDRTWDGRYCLQLLDRQLPKVIATLEQRAFTLEPGVGFSDIITVRFPDILDEGAYGLSLAVHRPGGPMVDLVPIRIGQTDETRRATTQRDMDASLEACPPVEGAGSETEYLVGLAKADLAQWLGIRLDEIEVQSVTAGRFRSAMVSPLGVAGGSMVVNSSLTPQIPNLLPIRVGQIQRANDVRIFPLVAHFDQGDGDAMGHQPHTFFRMAPHDVIKRRVDTGLDLLQAFPTRWRD
jgi:hypothetical protein